MSEPTPPPLPASAPKAPPGKRVTLKDIAQVVGVSAMTVSCALRNSPKVLPATRDKILKVAEQLGYRPDPEISKLMTHLRQPSQHSFSHTLAFINAWPDPDEHLKGYVGKLFHGASYRAAQLGFDLEPFWLQAKGMTDRRLSSILRNRGIRGVLLPPWHNSEQTIHFDWSHFSVVASSLSISSPAVNRVAPNVYRNTLMACEHLYKRGYRRLGFVDNLDWHRRSESLARGAFEMFQATRLAKASDGAVMLTDNNDPALHDWFTSYQPDAIISPSAGHYYQLQQTAPKPFGFIVLDALQDDRLTGIDQNPGKLGASAIELLVTQLMHNEFGIPESPNSLFINGHLRMGMSTPNLLKTQQIRQPKGDPGDVGH